MGFANDFQSGFLSIQKDLVNPFHGFIRLIFMPIPFITEKAHTFLDISALIHWSFNAICDTRYYYFDKPAV
ncbi:MAG: hypothetical protein WAW61_10360 [Methylococcaceae bacterium]